MVFAIGPAGTGKTYTAVAMAVRALKNRMVKKMILTRPAVEAGESLGFLPGDLKDKVDPYLRPIYDALADMIPAEKLTFYKENEVISRQTCLPTKKKVNNMKTRLFKKIRSNLKK